MSAGTGVVPGGPGSGNQDQTYFDELVTAATGTLVGDEVLLANFSGERTDFIRLINSECLATIGQVGNLDHENISIGKAGRSRWLGKRPHVRGVAMNPVDHPLGGGEGKTSGGRHPVTPWGKPTKGARTRHNKATDKMIIRSRHAKKKG